MVIKMETLRLFFQRFLKRNDRDVIARLLDFENYTKYEKGPFKDYLTLAFSECFVNQFLRVAVARRFNLAFYRHNTFIVCHQEEQIVHCLTLLEKNTNVAYQWLQDTDSLDGEYGLTVYLCNVDWIKRNTHYVDGILVYRGIRFNTYRIFYFKKDFDIEGLDAKYTYFMT